MNKSFILLISAVIVLGSVFCLGYFFLEPSQVTLKPDEIFFQEVEKEISTLKDSDYQLFFEKNMDSFFRAEGINGMIQRVIHALSIGQIDMFACHSLAHNLGHYAGYPDYFTDITDYTTKENLDFCGSGFMHGVEAQLANNQYPENIDDLYTFCKASMLLEPYYGGCYHGAGHSFLEQTRNPTESLKRCDLLKFDNSISPESCYRGVFSEYIDQLSRQGKQSSEVLDFCNSLSGEMQYTCAHEVNGLELPSTTTQADVEAALAICINSSYSRVVQQGCIGSVSGVAADRLLGQGKDIIPPEIIFSLPLELVYEYINSTHDAFVKTSSYDTSKTLDSFCAAFRNKEQQDFCRQK